MFNFVQKQSQDLNLNQFFKPIFFYNRIQNTTEIHFSIIAMNFLKHKPVINNDLSKAV